jgi:hypothetical protein
MEKQVLAELGVGVVVVGLLIYRQLVARRVSASGVRIALVLAVLGILETVQYLQKQHHDSGVTAAALGGSLVLAVAFGVARAVTVRIWQKDGSTWSQGNWITALLWAAALAAHLGYDYLLDKHHGTVGLGDATILLYLAITLGTQRLVLLQRAHRMFPENPAAPFFGAGPAT